MIPLFSQPCPLGVGYHLVMVKEASCDVDAVTNFIVQYVPDAKLESNVRSEVTVGNTPSKVIISVPMGFFL